LDTDCTPRLANPSKHQPKFPAGQPWFRVAKELVFIDVNESTIFGDRQSSDLEDGVEGQLPSGTLGLTSGPHLGRVAIEQHDEVANYTQIPEDGLGSTKDLAQSQASARFETLVEAAAECRTERSRSDPIDLTTEPITDTTSTTSTTGNPPVFDFTSDSKYSSVYAPRAPDHNDALSTHNFRVFDSPKDSSTGQVTPITPEAAFSLPRTPTLSSHEARLMQHFIEHLAPSIDVVCRDSIFGRLVPRMAFLSPILLTSIFAVASKHISKTIGITDPTPETYFQETLDHLIPVLNEPGALVEDYILAAVVILRVMEEMDSE
jgi:hypothetical protein